jgi:FG-GAP-like repeat
MKAAHVLILILFTVFFIGGGSMECFASQTQLETAATGSASPVCFTERYLGSIQYDVGAIIPVDFDIDGDTDLVITGYGGGIIAWFENSGTLSFTLHIIATYWGHPEDISVADLDGDGDLDIASTDAGIYPEDPGFVRWWENDGNQNFTAHDIDTERTGATPVETVDLDDDGDMDIVIGCRKNNNLFWYENDGNGSFSKHVLANKSLCYALDVIDVDRDSDLDVIAVGPGGFHGWVSWFENDGNQVFTENVIDPDFPHARDVCSADLDNDGDLDVICSATKKDDDEGKQIAWWENDGNQQFEKHVIVEDYDYPLDVESADFDKDGYMDIVSQNYIDGRYIPYLWRNSGNKAFNKYEIESETSSRELTIGDIDLDGDMDFVAGSYRGAIAWWENQPNVVVELSMPSHHYEPGDTFSLQAVIDNPSPDQTLSQMPLFALMYFGGECFFHPAWGQDAGYSLIDIPPGRQTIEIIEPFDWPSGAGEASGVYFFAALADQELTQLFGIYGYWEFGWSS